MKRNLRLASLVRKAMMLCLALFVSTTAWALSGAGTSASPYVISNATDWETFASDVNAGTNTDAYYKLADTFDNSSSPITTMVGTSDHPFAGYFNGSGKTLYVNINCSEQGGAPFHYIDGATIDMLVVAGTVTGTEYHAAGLVGFCKDNNPNVIQYCTVETNVVATGYGGGLVGHGGNGNLTILNCVYSGTISNFVNFAGGLLGWCDNVTVTMTDCLFKGSFSAGTNGKYHPIACRYDAASPTATCTNVFYLGNDATAASKYCLSGANGLKITSSTPSNAMYLIANAADGYSYCSTTSVSGVDSYYVLTGSVIHPVPTVKLSDGSVVPSSCYTVTYSGDGTTPGTYTMTIRGISSEGYEGTTTINYEITYQKPTNLTVSLTCADATKATISWTENGTATQWKVCLNGNESGAITVNTNPYTLTGLEAEHGYNVKVCAVRELGDSPWSDEFYFMPTEMVSLGMGSETASELPMNCFYKYGLTEQIYTAAELEASVNAGKAIESISLNCALTPTRNIDIYIVHTNKSSFSSTTDWIIPTADDKVFSGTVTFQSNGWTAITLDNPFVYDGTSNIAIMIDDNTGSYTNTTNFLAYSCAGYEALYFRSDGTNYDPMSPSTGTRYMRKSQMRVRFVEAPSCIKPTSFTVSQIKNKSAVVSWNSDGDAWNLEYKKSSDTDWTTVALTAKTYTLTGLTPETAYDVRVQTNCGGGDVSQWTTQSFTTLVSCPAPTDFAYTLTQGNGTIAMLNWEENGDATQWQICLNGDEANLITANTNPYTLTNLTPETRYGARVRAVGNGEYSAWSDSITFTPTNYYALTVNNNTVTNELVPVYGWWVDKLTASQFIIEEADLSVMEYGTINKLTFYSSDSSKSWGEVKFDVYLGEVAQTSFSSTTFVDWSTLQKVYAGSVSITDGKMEITLDDTYQYMGGNLLVGFNQTENGTYSRVYWYGVEKTNASVGGYGSSFDVQNFLPKTTFTYEPGTLPTCFKPKDLAVVGEPAARSVQLQWTAGSTDQTAWDVAYKADGDSDFTIVEGITSNPYTLTGLQQDTHYTVKVRGNCGGGDVSDWSQEVAFATAVAFPAPQNLEVVGDPGSYSVQLQWTAGSTDQTAWDVAYKADGDADFTIVEGITSNPYTLTGLQQDTQYIVKVRGNHGAGNVSNWSAEVVFRTDVAFPAPKNMTVADVTPHTATISWTPNTGATSYKLRYKKIDAPTMAMIMLKADDVWGDGTGYQMLFDADATAYDDVIPALDSSVGYLSDGSVYDQFEYKIPGNADGELTTQNIVLDDSLTLMIPAGTYDWCITNPTPGDQLWTASSYGTIPGRADDYVFEAGRQYTFHAYKHSSGHDAIDLTISLSPEALLTGSTGEWTVVNNATSPYAFAGLDTESFYVVQVQTVYADGESQWSATAFETPEENPVPYDVVVTPGATSADIAWSGFGNSYNVKYRRAEGRKRYFYEDFESGLDGWTVVRNGDGDDSFDWQVGTTSSAVSGNSVAGSFSWDGNNSYSVDNWLISPAVNLEGTLSFWVRDDGQYHDHFDVYVSTTTTDLAKFTLLSEPGNATDNWNEVTVDLSSYNGAKGYIAIRHTDDNQHYLLIDDFGIYGDSVYVGNWTTVNTADKSLTITGLEAATPYEYQIQSVKGSTTEWTPLDMFYTRANKMPGDVNDDARISIADVTETVNLIKAGGYDAAADVDGDNDVDSDDLDALVNIKLLGKTPVVTKVRKRMAPKAAIKPLNLSVKEGANDYKRRETCRTK